MITLRSGNDCPYYKHKAWNLCVVEEPIKPRNWEMQKGQLRLGVGESSDKGGRLR